MGTDDTSERMAIRTFTLFVRTIGFLTPLVFFLTAGIEPDPNAPWTCFLNYQYSREIFLACMFLIILFFGLKMSSVWRMLSRAGKSYYGLYYSRFWYLNGQGLLFMIAGVGAVFLIEFIHSLTCG